MALRRMMGRKEMKRCRTVRQAGIAARSGSVGASATRDASRPSTEQSILGAAGLRPVISMTAQDRGAVRQRRDAAARTAPGEKVARRSLRAILFEISADDPGTIKRMSEPSYGW